MRNTIVLAFFAAFMLHGLSAPLAGENSDREKGMPALKMTGLRKLFAAAIAQMNLADREVKDFLKKHPERRKYRNGWSTGEDAMQGRTSVVMRVYFNNEQGTPRMAIKRLYDSGDRSKELKEGGYTLYFCSTNGQLESFETRGDSERILSFWTTGTLKDFIATDAGKLLGEIRCAEDGSVTSEKWSGPETDNVERTP